MQRVFVVVVKGYVCCGSYGCCSSCCCCLHGSWRKPSQAAAELLSSCSVRNCRIPRLPIGSASSLRLTWPGDKEGLADGNTSLQERTNYFHVEPFSLSGHNPQLFALTNLQHRSFLHLISADYLSTAVATAFFRGRVGFRSHTTSSNESVSRECVFASSSSSSLLLVGVVASRLLDHNITTTVPLRTVHHYTELTDGRLTCLSFSFRTSWSFPQNYNVSGTTAMARLDSLQLTVRHHD